MLIINGHIKTDPALVEALAAELRGGVERTLKEDGCLFYAFAIDDAAAGSILAVERWRDEASLAAHLATPAIAALLGNWGDKVEIAVSKFDASNERGMGD